MISTCPNVQSISDISICTHLTTLDFGTTLIEIRVAKLAVRSESQDHKKQGSTSRVLHSSK